MNHGRKNRRVKGPLLVKEIILPEKKELKPNPRFPINNSEISPDNLKNGMSELNESTVKIGNHSVKAVKGLLILPKAPLENYYTGTKEKKHVKKKIKPHKVIKSFKELCNEESQTGLNEEMPGTSKLFSKQEDSLTKEEKIQMKMLQLKLQSSEKLKEYRYQNNYTRQRLTEKKYIQQQENLVETWWAFIKRRNQLKHIHSDDICQYQKSTCRNYCNNYNTINFSIISRKFWNDEQSDSLEKAEKVEERSRQVEKDEKQCRQAEKKCHPTLEESQLDDLMKGFDENLVFVDDEDDDEINLSF